MAVENATNLVVMIQVMMVADVALLIRNFWQFEIPIGKDAFKWLWGLTLGVGLLVFNHLRYRYRLNKDGYVFFHQRWDNEPGAVRRKRGWLIISLVVFLALGVPLLLVACRRDL